MSEGAGEQQADGDVKSMKVIVTNRDGLHTRPTVVIVNTVGRYRAKVTIRKGSQAGDASSAIDVLSLAATQGTELVLSATGPDAVEVLEALDRLFATEFGVSYSD
jgi:phosphotransferase system HPr (HPr) family protein